MEIQTILTFLGSAAIGALVGGLFSLLNTSRNHKKESESWLRDQRRELYLTISEKNDKFLSYYQDLAYATRVLSTPIDKRVYSSHEAEEILELSGQKITSSLNQLRIEQTKIQILGSRQSADHLAHYRTKMQENIHQLFRMNSKQSELDKTIDGLLTQQEQLWKSWEDSAKIDLGNKN